MKQDLPLFRLILKNQEEKQKQKKNTKDFNGNSLPYRSQAKRFCSRKTKNLGFPAEKEEAGNWTPKRIHRTRDY